MFTIKPSLLVNLRHVIEGDRGAGDPYTVHRFSSAVIHDNAFHKRRLNGTGPADLEELPPKVD